LPVHLSTFRHHMAVASVNSAAGIGPRGGCTRQMIRPPG